MARKVTRVVQGPPAFPLIGHWRPFTRNRLRFLVECHRQYGQTTRLHIVKPTFLINDPDDIQHVLVTGERKYGKSWQVTSPSGRRMFFHGLLAKHDAAHRQQRRIVQAVFHRHAITAFVDAIRTHIDVMLDAWAAASIVDVAAEMDRFAEQVLFRALLGKIDDELCRRLSETDRVRRRFIAHAFVSRLPLPQAWPTPSQWAFRRATRLQRRIIQELVAAARNGTADRDSLLSQMARAGTQAHHLADEDLVEEVGELLNAGFETTRDALTWSTYLMARHPDEAVRVRDEITRIIGQRSIVADDIPRLTYTDMFLSEAMRLFPPVWMFVRIALEDDQLPTGTRVPAGSKIYMCQYTAHRNEVFFPDPERFDPGRFSLEKRQTRPRFSYFPFGGGARVCVAESLARLEGVMVLASLARRFDLELCPGQTIEPIGAITLRPGSPIRVAVKPRVKGERLEATTSADAAERS